MSNTVPGWSGALAGVAIAAVACTIGYWWDLTRWLDDFDYLSGWAQAVGSVCAIFGTAWLAGRHHERVSADRARDEMIAVRNLAHVPVRFTRHVLKLERDGLHIARGHVSEYFASQFDVCQRAADAISPAQTISPSLVDTIIEVQNQFRRFQTRFRAKRPRSQRDRNHIDHEIDVAARELDRRLDILDQRARAMGAIPGPDGVFLSPAEDRANRRALGNDRRI